MAAKNKTCYNCGTKYRYCSTCFSDRNEPYWKATFHDENCQKLFQCCVDFNMNLITKEEAQEIVGSCDLTEMASLRKDVQKTIADIQSKDVVEAEVEAEQPKKVEYPFKKAKS